MLKTLFISLALSCFLMSSSGASKPEQTSTHNHSVPDYSSPVTLSKALIADKIKGGWAGQVIGCTYGGPTEFRYCGTMIQNYIPIDWDSSKMIWWYKNAPGLYDDVYMDLTFVDVFEKEGLDAPASSHAHAFANA